MDFRNIIDAEAAYIQGEPELQLQKNMVDIGC